MFPLYEIDSLSNGIILEMKNLKLLPKRDLICLLSICDMARNVHSLNQLQGCIHKLKTIVMFDGALSVYLDKSTIDHGRFPETVYHTVNFSEKFFRDYIKGRHYENSAVCSPMLMNWTPQHWRTAWAKDIGGKGKFSRQLALDYGYLDGWACANYHDLNNCMSAFIFAGRKAENDNRTQTILGYLIPHLAEALKGICNHSLNKNISMKKLKLTSRELEVLKWIEQGKSTWDVSMILNRSERVVKWHVKNVMRKLSALNRTHAVAIALRHGLID